MYIEIGQDQSQSVVELVRDMGMCSEVCLDMSGKERFIKATK